MTDGPVRICHIGNHPYAYSEELDGCECIARFQDYDMPKTPLFGVVPGGSKDTPDFRFHNDFDKGVNSYAKARGEGLAPKSTTVAGVEAAHREVRSQERALKKMGGAGEELRHVSGVGG